MVSFQREILESLSNDDMLLSYLRAAVADQGAGVKVNGALWPHLSAPAVGGVTRALVKLGLLVPAQGGAYRVVTSASQGQGANNQLIIDAIKLLAQRPEWSERPMDSERAKVDLVLVASSGVQVTVAGMARRWKMPRTTARRVIQSAATMAPGLTTYLDSTVSVQDSGDDDCDNVRRARRLRPAVRGKISMVQRERVCR